MILLNLSENEAEVVITALLKKVSEMEINKMVLEEKVKRLTEKLSCSENPNSSESEAGNNV